MGSGRSKPARRVFSLAHASNTRWMSTQNSARGRTHLAQPRRVLVAEDRVLAGDVPADHRQRHPRLEDDLRRLGVGPHVVLGERGDVAGAPARSAHYHAAPDLAGDGRVPQERQGHVR
jgi:hypothetical protein